MTKPFLKWAGGKHKLVPFIRHYLPATNHNRLIEPFAGSAALSLALEFEAYLLADINADLIVLYQSLKNEKHDFIQYAASFFTAENNQENQFYALRERFNETAPSVERAALFVYLNRHAFNGLCRYNKRGEFNVPFGRYRSPYFPQAEMQAFIAKAPRMELLHAPFEEILLQTHAEDVVYCDPPYIPLTATASFTAYATDGFNAAAQIKLAQLVEQQQQHCQRILVSNHDLPWTREIYAGAQEIACISVQRNIAAKGEKRGKAAELLAIYHA